MKCSVSLVVVILLTTLKVVTLMPQESSTTSRSTPPIGETIKQLTKQLMAINASSSDVVFDTRTPPKIKQQVKRREELMENSHAGIAVPVDEDSLLLEESNKKLNFYKIEKPTTNSGISTWILLSGQASTPTNKPKVIARTGNDTKNATLANNNNNRNTKPVFKKRTTIKTPTTTPPTTKMTKVKASVLNNALNKKNDSTTSKKPTETTTTKSTTLHTKTTDSIKTTTVEIKNITDENISTNAIDTNNLPIEAKEGDLELTTKATDQKKTRRPNNKRKKNKNRRKRPVNDKTSGNNSTKIGVKEKPISTQIYNYLSREVMPTVGVGLVGLMVTAGLASYFLYPFGAARRSYDIDRKDKEGSYYYNDYYALGGVAEEEVIGKVIAGMPANSNYKSYRAPTTRPSYSNIRHRQVDQKFSQLPETHSNHNMNPQGSVETVQITTSVNYNGDDSYVPHKNHQNDYYKPEYKKEDRKDDQKFIVGNAPNEAYQEITPISVPEHGPRGFNFRRKRTIDDKENEILETDNFNKIQKITTTNIETTIKPIFTSTMKSNVTNMTTNDKFNSFVSLIRDLFRMKLNLGLRVLKNATQSVSDYLTNVQKRLETHYKNNPTHR